LAGSVFYGYCPYVGRVVVVVIALTSPTMVAFLTAAIAQELEIPLDAVRTEALSAAGLIFAAVAAASLLTRNK
jgi:hypothetical protein